MRQAAGILTEKLQANSAKSLANVSCHKRGKKYLPWQNASNAEPPPGIAAPHLAARGRALSIGPNSAANRNPPKPYGSPALCNGSPNRTNPNEPSPLRRLLSLIETNELRPATKLIFAGGPRLRIPFALPVCPSQQGPADDVGQRRGLCRRSGPGSGREKAEQRRPAGEGPMVRIHLPPPESLPTIGPSGRLLAEPVRGGLADTVKTLSKTGMAHQRASEWLRNPRISHPVGLRSRCRRLQPPHQAS